MTNTNSIKEEEKKICFRLNRKNRQTENNVKETQDKTNNKTKKKTQIKTKERHQ